VGSLGQLCEFSAQRLLQLLRRRMLKMRPSRRRRPLRLRRIGSRNRSLRVVGVIVGWFADVGW